jgi:hypothetical protein
LVLAAWNFIVRSIAFSDCMRASVIWHRSRANGQPLGFAAQLSIEICDLRAQLLDAWMLVEQRR